MPGVSATTAGTAFGFALQVYINSVRKLPLTRRPWQYAVLMGAGAVAANAIVDFEEQMEADIERTLAARKDSNRRRFGSNE